MYKSRQEIFDNAYNGLKSQNWQRAKNDNGQCLYRAKDGSKCALGWNIPDGCYKPVFEKLSQFMAVLEASNIDKSDRFFAVALQECHDDSSNGIEERLLDFAARYKLSVPQ